MSRLLVSSNSKARGRAIEVDAVVAWLAGRWLAGIVTQAAHQSTTSLVPTYTAHPWHESHHIAMPFSVRLDRGNHWLIEEASQHPLYLG